MEQERHPATICLSGQQAPHQRGNKGRLTAAEIFFFEGTHYVAFDYFNSV